MAVCLAQMGRLAEAESVFVSCSRHMDAAGRDKTPAYLDLLLCLVRVRLDQGHCVEAVDTARQRLSLIRSIGGAPP